MEGISQVTCPSCSFQFPLESALTQQIADRVREELEQKQSEQKRIHAEKERQLSELANFLQKQQSEIEALVSEKLSGERQALAEKLKRELQMDFENQVQSLNMENQEKRKKIQELLALGIENEQLKRRYEEREQELRFEYETKVTVQLRDETEKIARRENEKNELKFREKDLLIGQLNDQLRDAQLKIQQGSVQLQGEVQELALEELLREQFQFDLIREVRKGQRGADVLQEIRNNHESVCGKIYYESKRTKTYGGEWVEKLKEDNRTIMADACVLVTQTLPDDIDRIGQKDGIWICSFEDVRWLSKVLRQAVIQISSVNVTQANRGDKMHMLYDYLTSNEFRMQFEAIVEGFKGLQDSYNDEKLKMQKIWKEREKQLDKVLINAVSFYGSIKGIANEAIPAIRMLEESPVLPEESTKDSL